MKDLDDRKGLKYTPDQIVVSNGAKQSVIQALLCVVSPNDEVIIPAPYWPSYPDMVKMCQANPVIVPTLAQDNYIISPETLLDSLKKHPKVKAIILCNPSNPTGGVADKNELMKLAEVLNEFPQVLVIADEIYEQLTYDTEHISFASMPDMFDRTVTINGFSKSHSMTGYRIGYAASPIDIAKGCSKLQSQMTSCASSIGQEAALAALEKVSPDWIEQRRQELKSKRDIAYDLITSIPQVTCPKPKGAFYLLPEIACYFGKTTINGKTISNADDLCLELLREKQVALVSGDAFGAPGCIRLSYATSLELIREAITRLNDFLLSLK